MSLNKLVPLSQFGRLIKSADGERKFRTKGLLQHVQGMGVPLESHNMSQVSMNLQNYRVTNLHMHTTPLKVYAKIWAVLPTE